MDFYTQSDLTVISEKKPVRLMVIGINPGLGGSFKPNRFDSKPIDLDAWKIAMREPIKIFIQKRNDREEIKLETYFRWQYIYTSLCNYCKYTLHLEESEKNKDWTRFFIKDSDGKNRFILALVNQNNDKSIGLDICQQTNRKIKILRR